ncbi:hypothetical protein SCUCBS95973_004269 [Sporothrix curviconia]|uniref:HNH nuclease domain-containing protein n=1 Tax=Sporothrix curviconia TaxID=1260050 RepID=A0ABP0BM99_9PEZI
MAGPSHHRHQASLEDVLDFSSTTPTPLLATERAGAQRTFYHIVDHFRALEVNTGPGGDPQRYSQALLIRSTYEQAISQISKDIYLRAFFQALSLDLSTPTTALRLDELAAPFVDFAEYLMNSFFLPMRASTGQTPQPSPAAHSAVMQALGGGVAGQGFVGTTERLAALRGMCLVRDRHRCVVTRKFSFAEYSKRFKEAGANARDDDGVLFSQQTSFGLDQLEVAHILPHSLMKANDDKELDKSREAALSILNMFDYGVAHIIDGVEIDRPINAMTLAISLHYTFGRFETFLTPVPNEKNMYRIESFMSPMAAAYFGIPVTRTLFVTDTHTIDPPSPRLLAVHRAIAHILHLSGAGDYIDRVLRDMETNLVRADGSSELGLLVGLRLDGWVAGRVY